MSVPHFFSVHPKLLAPSLSPALPVNGTAWPAVCNSAATGLQHRTGCPFYLASKGLSEGGNRSRWAETDLAVRSPGTGELGELTQAWHGGTFLGGSALRGGLPAMPSVRRCSPAPVLAGLTALCFCFF